MPSKTKKAIAATAALPSIPKELIEQFVSGPMSPLWRPVPLLVHRPPPIQERREVALPPEPAKRVGRLRRPSD